MKRRYWEKREHGTGDSHQTMVRFLGSIIIALSIESLMLVFKFALNDPSQIVYAVYLISGVTLLILGLSYYIKVSYRDDSNNQIRENRNFLLY